MDGYHRKTFESYSSTMINEEIKINYLIFKVIVVHVFQLLKHLMKLKKETVIRI